MKNKVPYPKGRLLLVHDCTVDICLNNNPGAVLLSVLLFWYENPHAYDMLSGNDFTMCRTQSSIEKQSCNQIDVKTIHDTAVPLLQLLGYLSVQEKMNGNLYTLHMDRIFAAFAAYENGHMKAFLKAQLESAPIVLAPSEIERTLINKHWLYFEIERTLNATRAASNCKRGRKPRVQAASDSKTEETETYRDSIERGVMREGEDAFAVAQSSPAFFDFSEDEFFDEDERKAPTEMRLPAIPKNVTAVSDSQPVYRQGDTDGHTTTLRTGTTSDWRGRDRRSADSSARSGDHGDSGQFAQGAVNGHLPATAHPDVDSAAAQCVVGHMAPAERGDAAGDDHPGVGYSGIAAASAVRSGTVHVVPSAEMAGDGAQGASRAGAVPTTSQAKGASNGQLTPTQQTFPASTDAAATVGVSPSPLANSEPRASDGATVSKTSTVGDIPRMAETAAQIRKRVDRRADDLLALYCALMGDKVTRSKENMEAMRELAEADRSDEEVTLVMRNILDDPDDFLARQLTPRKLASNFTPRLRLARDKPAQAPVAPKPTPTAPRRRNFSEEYREEMLQARRGNV